MSTIGNKTIEGASELVSGLLRTYRTELDKAYMKAEGALSVSISLTFKPAETLTGTDIEAKIKFVTDQVKDSAGRVVDERQEELFQSIKDGSIKIAVDHAEVTSNAV